MGNIKIAAVIVLYNPDINRLEENISAVIGQIDMLVLVDNGSNNIQKVEKKYAGNAAIHIIKNSKNQGIAKALNQGICLCSQECKWVLTLDQDSVVPENLMSEYKKYINKDKIGILTPFVHDRHEKYYKKEIKEFEKVEMCITSGALINTQVWKELGGYDEKMFIDIVDFEFCYRVIWAGYYILRVNKVELLHECGSIRQINVGVRKIIIYNHSAQRKYYFARNWIYIYKKYSNKIALSFVVKQYIVLFIKVLLFEKHKTQKLIAIMRGINDGAHARMGENNLY